MLNCSHSVSLCFFQRFFWRREVFSGLAGVKNEIHLFLFLIFLWCLTLNNRFLGELFCFVFFFVFLRIEELLNGAHIPKKNKKIKKSNLLEVQGKCPWSKAAHVHPPAASKRIHSKSTTNEYTDWNILPLSFWLFFFFFSFCQMS